MEIKFIKNERALVFGDYLVIADLHIGYDKLLKEKGYTIPRQVGSFIERLKKLKEETGAVSLIILGDVKHNIPYITTSEYFEVKQFLNEISKMFKKIIIVKGNHDGRIERLIWQKNIKVVDELIVDDITFIHGHKYPSEEAMKSKLLIMAHIHPTLKLKDNSGTTHRYPYWIIGRIKKGELKRYKEIKCEKVIVMPSFNPLTSGHSKLNGVFAKAIKKEEKILLDLTRVS